MQCRKVVAWSLANCGKVHEESEPFGEVFVRVWTDSCSARATARCPGTGKRVCSCKVAKVFKLRTQLHMMTSGYYFPEDVPLKWPNSVIISAMYVRNLKVVQAPMRKTLPTTVCDKLFTVLTKSVKVLCAPVQSSHQKRTIGLRWVMSQRERETLSVTLLRRLCDVCWRVCVCFCVGFWLWFHVWHWLGRLHVHVSC